MFFNNSNSNNNSHKKNSSFVLMSNISKSFNKTQAVSNLNLEIYEKEFLSLLGPSGSGKTTILRLLAGLERPNEGCISIDGLKVASHSNWIPPEQRGVGVVFQDYALFPHLTVFKNIAFGLKELNKKEIDAKVKEMLELVGLSDLGKRYPHELSGGQQQRIALARALAPAPKVMLLDEPFSNLDADLRFEIRTETKRILQKKGTTTILVTHDQEEAFSLSDRVGVLNNGTIIQVDTPINLFHKPVSRFVANFVGRADYVSGKIQASNVLSEFGTFEFNHIPTNDFHNNIMCECGDPLTDVDLMIRPDDVIFVDDSEGDCTIIDSQFLGGKIIYNIQLPSRVTIRSTMSSTIVYPKGTVGRIKFDSNNIVYFPKSSEKAIDLFKKN
ncbi:MAG: ABC transporter ATP-binding protein [Chlorobiaceae bacterium]|nr:ABC transporter ATP-binding protein [Chlorobiaceae bacterium]MBA4310866.1 ABC transporter ATP-binding protein [Chlorobiaceae bacterium]